MKLPMFYKMDLAFSFSDWDLLTIKTDLTQSAL